MKADALTKALGKTKFDAMNHDGFDRIEAVSARAGRRRAKGITTPQNPSLELNV
jgi:hypothetical protein